MVADSYDWLELISFSYKQNKKQFCAHSETLLTTRKLGAIALALALFGAPSLGSAAEYPADKPIKMVVGFTAGGAADKLDWFVDGILRRSA